MQIKCTSCGATQQLAANDQCGYCGSAIEQEKAQENYNTSTKGEVGNLMMMADTAVDATNWEEAMRYYNKALEKDIANYDAWLGKGIAIVYTSKIGELKITEAIAYWKNALKHSTNQEAMGKRVAKEINEVVNKFYPSLENHFVQFKDLDNSYGELVSKFVTLEAAQDYAVELDPNNITYSKTGYNLCKRVINIPKSHAIADYGGAIAGAIIGGLQGNKYTQRDAVAKGRKATALKDLINQAAQLVYPLEEKYINKIKNLNPSEQIVSSRDVFVNSKEGKEFEVKQIIAKEGAMAGLKHRWNNLSDAKKAIFIIIVIIYVIALAVGGSK
jgi:tetratricopeptide (TPR) repeat protein